MPRGKTIVIALLIGFFVASLLLMIKGCVYQVAQCEKHIKLNNCDGIVEYCTNSIVHDKYPILIDECMNRKKGELR